MKFLNLVLLVSFMMTTVAFAQVAVDPNSLDSGILESTADSSYPENSVKACHVQSTFSADGPTLFDGSQKINLIGDDTPTGDKKSVK